MEEILIKQKMLKENKIAETQKEIDTLDRAIDYIRKLQDKNTYLGVEVTQLKGVMCKNNLCCEKCFYFSKDNGYPSCVRVIPETMVMQPENEVCSAFRVDEPKDEEWEMNDESKSD